MDSNQPVRQPEQQVKPVVTEPPVVAQVAEAVPVALKPKQRHFLAAFFLSFMWGTFGVDRFYLGKWGTGILKLLTLGGFGFWTVIDLLMIMTGVVRDKNDQPLLQFAEYKKFANRVVLIFAIIIGLIVLINGIAIIFALNYFFTMLTTDGGLDSLLQQLPGGGAGFGPQIPPDLQEYYY